jgi:para-aminobenzoate synthetase component 1
MTGAPKLSAMQVSEQVEKSKRGIYSGSVGYIDASGDFDFNVVIRSMVYNEGKKYLSYYVGGAITALSVENEEYQECLLKAKAITKLLKENTDTAM